MMDDTLSLVLAAERTLFATWNVAMLILLLGAGLMAINEDLVPKCNGIALIVGSIGMVASAYIVHARRTSRIRNGLWDGDERVSEVWTGVIAVLLVSAAVLELVYAIKFPFLERTQSVDVEG